MHNAVVFFHLIFVGFMALFSPVNPLGTALLVDPYLQGLNHESRKSAARSIAVYCLMLCTGTLLAGSWVFQLFGISLPVVQVAGGILIAKMGWDLLGSSEPEKTDSPSPQEIPLDERQGVLFFPLAFPMTTGAGTISVLLTLSAHSHDANMGQYALKIAALVGSALLISIVIYFCYAFTPALLKRLGENGQKIVNRLSAFIVFCVGLQIFMAGLTLIVKKLEH